MGFARPAGRITPLTSSQSVLALAALGGSQPLRCRVAFFPFACLVALFLARFRPCPGPPPLVRM